METNEGVFKSKVWKKLYGVDIWPHETQSDEGKTPKIHVHLVENVIEPVPAAERKMYMAAPPPPGFKSNINTDGSATKADLEFERSASSDSDEEIEVKRKRRRRGKKIPNDVLDSCLNKSCSDSQYAGVTKKGENLTKNQKRKLKKKKAKAKKRLEDVQGEVREEFTFTGTIEEKEEPSAVSSDPPEDMDGIINFFESVWDVYSTEVIAKGPEQENMEELPQVYLTFKQQLVEPNIKENGKLLHQLKSCLSRGDRTQAEDLVKSLAGTSFLSSDGQVLLESLVRYWFDEVMVHR